MSKFEWFLGRLPDSKTLLKPLEKAVFHEEVLSKCSFTQQQLWAHVKIRTHSVGVFKYLRAYFWAVSQR